MTIPVPPNNEARHSAWEQLKAAMQSRYAETQQAAHDSAIWCDNCGAGTLLTAPNKELYNLGLYPHRCPACENLQPQYMPEINI